MKLRKAVPNDFNQIVEIFAQAKLSMANIKLNQWQDGSPTQSDFLNDINLGISYVVEISNIVVGHASFFIGEDPTYKEIDGRWASDENYGVIHKLMTHSKLKKSGVASYIIEQLSKICIAQNIDWLRIDTHQDNAPMLRLLEKQSFHKRGIIIIANGSKRIAFDKKLS